MNSSLVIFTTLLSVLIVRVMSGQKAATAQVPCLFIFGDSLSDSGNNNDLITGAKCNFPPYGVDFPDGPTGRFTNGRTAIDLIGDHLGLPGYIKSYPMSKDGDPSLGVNYASGSSGILDETGWQVGDRICMNKQVERHKEMVGKIISSMGEAQGRAHLNKCLYSIYAGSNDWMFNYFSRPTVMATHMIPTMYADQLIDTLTGQIDAILSTGAKKVMVFGMSPLGCLPILNLIGTCSPPINEVLKMFNDKLKELVDKYNQRQGLQFIYIDTMSIFNPDNLQTLVSAGLENTNMPCCGVTPECIPFSIPCQDRNTHAYWDQEHPTEAANTILARRAFKAEQPTDTHPMDISALARL